MKEGENLDLSPLRDWRWFCSRGLNTSRSTGYRMRRAGPEFPRPYLVHRSEKWTERQIAEYREILRQRAAGEYPIPATMQLSQSAAE